ncbi:MAG: hypothetical protein ABIK93_10275 [candidate division WOR-3 bacterium]
MNKIRPTKWNKEKILNRIKVLNNQCRAFTPAYAFYHHRNLYQAAVRHFGSFRKALRAAGLGKGLRRERKWSKEKIIVEIRKYARRRIPLNYSNINRRTRRLINAAIRYFGSWRKAVIKAGFDYDKIKKRR